jgi:HlyD family secretion protein
MELKVRVGDRVKKGQVLGRLDTLELERRYQNSLAVVSSREADLAGAEAGNQKQSARIAKADYDQALAHKERLEKLYESGAVTKEELEKAELEVSKLEGTWREARTRELNGADLKQIASYNAQLELARKEAEVAKDRLEMASFTAPFDGVVTKVEVKQGNRVTEGSLILAIADDSTLEINASVNEIDAGEIKVGQTVKVSSLALRGKKYTGIVEQVGGAAVNVKATDNSVKVPVLIKLHKPGKELKVGYTVDLSIKTAEFHNALALPLQSIMEQDGKKSVWLVKTGCCGNKTSRAAMAMNSMISSFPGSKPATRWWRTPPLHSKPVRK